MPPYTGQNLCRNFTNRASHAGKQPQHGQKSIAIPLKTMYDK